MNIFKRTKNPTKGLFPLEIVVFLYLLFTLVVMFIMRNELLNIGDMLLFRLRVVVFTMAVWALYRLFPCGATALLRVLLQVFFLINWYPDTYEFSRCFNNMDHIFCDWEQTLFGCQPAIVFSQLIPWRVVSELLDMGYASYYFIIFFTLLFYFFYRKQQFQRAAFIVLGSFLIYCVVFIFLPVAGPTFYYRAVGLDVIEQGVFPSLGHYFTTHSDLSLDCLPTPGWQDGIMWKLVEIAKSAGERPIAAFPSSHIGVTVVCLFLLWRAKNKKIFYIVTFFAILMFFATVYIQAHYAVDALAGLVSGILLFFLLWLASLLFKSKGAPY